MNGPSKYNVNNSIEKSINAYVINGSSYEVCLITTKEEEGETILNLNENSPRLYFTFPLIGTEEYCVRLFLVTENREFKFQI